MGRFIRGRGAAAALLAFASALPLTAQAQAASAKEMQRALNAEVLGSAFNAGDLKKAQEYADAALKRGESPVGQAPDYWQPGWDCGSMTRYRYYRYSDYRDCVYHHRYYGYYW